MRVGIITVSVNDGYIYETHNDYVIRLMVMKFHVEFNHPA